MPTNNERTGQLSNLSEKELTESAILKANEFRHRQPNGATSKVICAAKKIIFEERQSEELDTTRVGKLSNIIAAVRYIIEEVMGLTPAEYDAIYSVPLNQKVTLDHAIRKIINCAPPSVVTEALFDTKAIFFAMCFPEYYKESYQKPTAMKVFNATGDIKGNLIRAGRPKEIPREEKEIKVLNNGKFSSAKDRKRTYNHGQEVDKIVYWAMSSILPVFEMSTPELFLSLAKPRSSGWSKYGFVKVIDARECYPTPLDFYMWNSPAEYQVAHIEEYMEARKKAKLKPIPALDIMYTAYKKSRTPYEERTSRHTSTHSSFEAEQLER